MSKNRTLELASEERLVAIVRRSMLSNLPRLIFMTLWVLVPFFFFFPLLAFGPIGLLVFVGLSASGIVYALREWHMWYHTMWVITDHRLIDIDQIGWAVREVHEIPLKKIRRVHIRRSGLVSKLFRYGTLWVETSSSQSFDIELEGAPSPKKVKALLRDVKTYSHENRTNE